VKASDILLQHALLPFAPIRRGSTRLEMTDSYVTYIRAEGIRRWKDGGGHAAVSRKPGQRELVHDHPYWTDIQAITAFIKCEPIKVHGLERTPNCWWTGRDYAECRRRGKWCRKQDSNL
jgi:hypothetical protein